MLRVPKSERTKILPYAMDRRDFALFRKRPRTNINMSVYKRNMQDVLDIFMPDPCLMSSETVKTILEMANIIRFGRVCTMFHIHTKKRDQPLTLFSFVKLKQ